MAFRLILALPFLIALAAQAQPVQPKEADFGLPQAQLLAPAPQDFRPVVHDTLPVPAPATVALTDSVQTSTGRSLTMPDTATATPGSSTAAGKSIPDRRLDPVRKPDHSDPKDPVVRVGNATATLLTGVASTTFGVCYWKYSARINREIEDKPVNRLGLMIAATLAIPVGALLTWAGITMLF